MALELSQTALNAELDSIATTMGTGGTLLFRTGARPGAANSATGTLISTQTAVIWAAASGGQKTFTTTPDSAAAAAATPGYFRLMKSDGSTVVVEGTAGVGVAAVAGAATVSGGAVTAVANPSTPGSGYAATTPLPCLVIGGGGEGAIVTATVAGGVVTGFTVVFGGNNYSSAPTILVPPPFDITFASSISLGGNVSTSSAVLTAGNA